MIHPAKIKSTLPEQTSHRDDNIIYVEPTVTLPFPTANTTLTDTTSVFPLLSQPEQRLLKEAYTGVGKGVSKKGIYFGAAALYTLVSGEQKFAFGFNTDTDAGDTFCAERNLLDHLSRIKGFSSIRAIAIVANLYSDKAEGHEGPRAPCHACRQQIRNVIPDPSLPVYMASSKWNDIIVTRMGNLLPLAYLSGKKFDAATILKFKIPTLKIFASNDLKYRSKNGDNMAGTILEVASAAKQAYPQGVKFKNKFQLGGTATGVAAAVSKPVRVGSGSQVSYEDMMLTAFSPTLGGKSAIRGLMSELQRTCGIEGRVNVVGIHGHPADFPGALPIPSGGARQAVYDRVFFQNTNALFVLTAEGSNQIVTVDARHLLPLGKPVMDYLDIAKHKTLAQSLVGPHPK